MGDAPAATLDLCQVWSVKLGGVDIHSSRCPPRPQSTSGASSRTTGNTGPGVPESVLRQDCSRLLREGGSSPGDVTVEVSLLAKAIDAVGVGAQ